MHNGSYQPLPHIHRYRAVYSRNWLYNGSVDQKQEARTQGLSQQPSREGSPGRLQRFHLVETADGREDALLQLLHIRFRAAFRLMAYLGRRGRRSWC